MLELRSFNFFLLQRHCSAGLLCSGESPAPENLTCNARGERMRTPPRAISFDSTPTYLILIIIQ
jgi:hypothetical protein